MEDVLVTEDVRRRYGDHVALDGVSLSVEAGEVFCCIGPNGAGKTTFVRALTGTTDYEGRISVFGEPPTAVDRSRIGLLPQEFSPPARLTARELIDYYGGLYDAARETDELLSDLGLADSAGTRYGNLSGGQRRRVCVGAALVNDPDLLYLDEPTTAIDPAGRRALWRLLEGLVEEGTTIFLTTHDMAEAERLADRVGLLAEGRLAEVGTPAALIDAHGGESRLTIETRERPAAGTEALSAADYRVEARESDLAVYDVPPARIGEVIGELNERGVEYDGLAWSQPTLEDAYLRLTGTAVGRGGDPVANGELDRTEPTNATDSGSAADEGRETDESTASAGESGTGTGAETDGRNERKREKSEAQVGEKR